MFDEYNERCVVVTIRSSFELVISRSEVTVEEDDTSEFAFQMKPSGKVKVANLFQMEKI